MPLDAFLQNLRLVPILIVFAVQAVYGLFVCETSFFALMATTGVLLVPAFLWHRASSFGGVLGACVGLIPWIVWANHIECVAPYDGGGAAMAYVAVFFWGFPSSVLCGFLFVHLQKKVLSNEDR